MDEHHDHEKIVEVARVPSPVEAEALVAELEGHGIKAVSSAEDAGSWRPNLTFAGGYRILVFENDIARAEQIITDWETPAATPADETADDSVE